ncbi:MAG: hypothetical protein B7Y53_02590 [Halothiobacillus sp. 28-55-5]|nr:MAG: hypothetical protein B7Y53_02590 [Halothiobacillus sp. 28-55-5]
MKIEQPIDPVDLYSEAARTQNVFGQPLQVCSMAPLTGAQRSGYCGLSPRDLGVHGVCARMTDAFLAYTLKQGNDLITPQPWASFPGLQAGDFWCVCAGRWQQALDAGVAPPINPYATSFGVLSTLFAADLNRHLWIPPAQK